MTRTIALSLLAAATAFVATAPAEAAKCSCATAKHRSHHVRHRSKTVRTEAHVAAGPTAIIVESADGGVHTYETPESGFLPDPVRLGSTWPADGGEITIADHLDKTLDLWRICGWHGSEYAAYVFNGWARTHMVGNRMRSGGTTTADVAFARTSGYRQRDAGYQPDRTAICAEANKDYPKLKEGMENDADALEASHRIAHKR